jgi:hypothetical protein
LGLLNYIRIWHDNTGEGASASWFLKYVIVRDLQTMEKFHFICQTWFAVERDDEKVCNDLYECIFLRFILCVKQIERLLPVASELEKRDFSYVLSKQAYHSVSEGHLWFSIFSRPPSNRFTCVQRCTCCFVLLFVSMFLNIMYYDLSSQAKLSNNTANSLSTGPFYISSQQVDLKIFYYCFYFIVYLRL